MQKNPHDVVNRCIQASCVHPTWAFAMHFFNQAWLKIALWVGHPLSRNALYRDLRSSMGRSFLVKYILFFRVARHWTSSPKTVSRYQQFFFHRRMSAHMCHAFQLCSQGTRMSLPSVLIMAKGETDTGVPLPPFLKNTASRSQRTRTYTELICKPNCTNLWSGSSQDSACTHRCKHQKTWTWGQIQLPSSWRL